MLAPVVFARRTGEPKAGRHRVPACGAKHREALMVQPSSFTTPARHRPEAPQPTSAPYQPEDFPGCEPFHLPANQINRYEGRLEFWDASTETAWKVCDVSIQHE